MSKYNPDLDRMRTRLIEGMKSYFGAARRKGHDPFSAMHIAVATTVAEFLCDQLPKLSKNVPQYYCSWDEWFASDQHDQTAVTWHVYETLRQGYVIRPLKGPWDRSLKVPENQPVRIVEASSYLQAMHLIHVAEGWQDHRPHPDWNPKENRWSTNKASQLSTT